MSVEISVMTYGHPLWDKTISFAENCSWKAGPYLAKMMRNKEFSETERVFVASEGEEIIGVKEQSLQPLVFIGNAGSLARDRKLVVAFLYVLEYILIQFQYFYNFSLSGYICLTTKILDM